MQFIVPRGSRRLIVRHEGPALWDRDHMVRPKSRRLYANFVEGIPEPFWGIAKELFPSFADQTEKPIERFGGFYDSVLDQQQQGWTDEEREAIEKRLLDLGGDYVKVEKPKAPLPYREYAKHRKIQGRRTVEHAVADILEALKITSSADAVIVYERDHLDEHSDAVIQAVEDFSAVKEPEEEYVAA